MLLALLIARAIIPDYFVDCGVLLVLIGFGLYVSGLKFGLEAEFLETELPKAFLDLRRGEGEYLAELLLLIKCMRIFNSCSNSIQYALKKL